MGLMNLSNFGGFLVKLSGTKVTWKSMLRFRINPSLACKINVPCYLCDHPLPALAPLSALAFLAGLAVFAALPFLALLAALAALPTGLLTLLPAPAGSGGPRPPCHFPS